MNLTTILTFILLITKIKERSSLSINKNINKIYKERFFLQDIPYQKLVEKIEKHQVSNIYFASAAPIVKYPNVYGIDIPTSKELIANNKNEIEIAKTIGADKIFYNDLDDVIECCLSSIPKTDISHNYAPREFETSCFNGHYITGNIDTDYLNELESKRK